MDLGDPPDSSHPAFGPQNNFRPLVLVMVRRILIREFDEARELISLDREILDKREIEVDGIKGERLVITTHKSLPEVIVFLKKEKHSYGFIVSGTEGAEEERSIEIFDQILSTFRFAPHHNELSFGVGVCGGKRKNFLLTTTLVYTKVVLYG